MVVAIDGPAASGKSSTAQWVAKELGFRHVDSGALYRAATACVLRDHGEESWTERDVLVAADTITLVPQETSFVPWRGELDLSEAIRGAAVTAAVPRVAQMPGVRGWVNDRVREVASGWDVVVDGRDMGTAVFPGAQVKVFLVADPRERARRRLIQRLSRGPTPEEVDQETERLLARDHADASQTLPAPDAVRIDTTTLTQADQVERIVRLVRARQGPGGPPFAGM